MKTKTFEELICDSRLLNSDTLSELELMLKEYPFCQTFHLLYTKNLYLQKHIRYHHQLKLAAAITVDRSRLKHYIEDSDVAVNGVSDHLYPPEVKWDESTNDSKDKSIEAQGQTDRLNMNHEPENLNCDFVLQPLTDSLPEVQTNVKLVQPDDEKPESTQPVNWDADSETLLLSALDAEISREEKKKAIIALINKKFSERINAAKDIKADIATTGTESDNTPEDKSEIFSEMDDDLNQTHVVLMESPKVLSYDPYPSVDLTLPDVPERKEQVHLESASANEDIESSDEESPTSPKTGLISSDVLIERFLRDAPRISRPKKEFFNPVNLAARSVEENEDFYTETYASICLLQGNVPKAIKIYEKLSLKFPEKSSYFAGLIEKIKKEQNI